MIARLFQRAAPALSRFFRWNIHHLDMIWWRDSPACLCLLRQGRKTVPTPQRDMFRRAGCACWRRTYSPSAILNCTGTGRILFTGSLRRRAILSGTSLVNAGFRAIALLFCRCNIRAGLPDAAALAGRRQASVRAPILRRAGCLWAPMGGSYRACWFQATWRILNSSSLSSLCGCRHCCISEHGMACGTR